MSTGTAYVNNDGRSTVFGFGEQGLKSVTVAASSSVRLAVLGVGKRITGVFPGGVTIADDFLETPECSKEYV